MLVVSFYYRLDCCKHALDRQLLDQGGQIEQFMMVCVTCEGELSYGTGRFLLERCGCSAQCRVVLLEG